MSEYKRGLVKSAVAAILLASLLGALISSFFQPGSSPALVAFAFDEGAQSTTGNSMIDGLCMILEFRFLNGSTVTENPFPSLSEMSEPSSSNEYSGGFNAGELQRITLSIHPIKSLCFDSKTIVKGLIIYVQNRTINATLLNQDQETMDLGSSTSRDMISSVRLALPQNLEQDDYDISFNSEASSSDALEQESSSTGYWKVADSIWQMTTDQLAHTLEGSGTAYITFTVSIDMELNYTLVKTSKEELTGRSSLARSIVWGELQLEHEEGKTSWILYNFSKIVKLTMTVNQ